MSHVHVSYKELVFLDVKLATLRVQNKVITVDDKMTDNVVNYKDKKSLGSSSSMRSGLCALHLQNCYAAFGS